MAGQPPSKPYQCSRALVRLWSPAFEVVVRHGNRLASDNPSEIVLGDVDPMIFEAAACFMRSGVLPESATTAMPPASTATHPLLAFADMYDLQELKESYAHTLLQQVPIALGNAADYLNLGIRYSVPPLIEMATEKLVSGQPPNPSVSFATEFKKQFLKLEPSAASAVLRNDNLHIKSYGDFKEFEVLQLVREWVGVNREERCVDAWELLESVRLCLLGYVQLTDLESGIEGDAEFSGLARKLLPAIRRALQDKLANPDPISTMRKRTSLVSGENEARAAKVARSVLRLSCLDS